MKILLPGKYPMSEKLIAAERDFVRNRISKSSLDQQINEDVGLFKELQNGLPYASTGLFQWKDLLRPFADIIENSHAESLSRFYETNTFWRTLEVDRQLKFSFSESDAWLDKYFFESPIYDQNEHILFTLPFLYLFKDYSSGISLENIAQILLSTAEKLLSFPNKSLCFFEPTFGWRNISDEEKKFGRALLEKLKKRSDAPIFLTTFFYPIEQEKEFLFSLPVDGIGIDFYINPLTCLKSFPKDKKILAGIINTQSTLLESNENMKSFGDMLRQYIPEDQVYLIPNGPAELLPREIMDKKVKNLKGMTL